MKKILLTIIKCPIYLIWFYIDYLILGILSPVFIYYFFKGINEPFGGNNNLQFEKAWVCKPWVCWNNLGKYVK